MALCAFSTMSVSAKRSLKPRLESPDYDPAKCWSVLTNHAIINENIAFGSAWSHQSRRVGANGLVISPSLTP